MKKVKGLLRRDPSAIAAAKSESHPPPITPADRRTRGKRLRDAVPRDAHTAWRAHAGRDDPISILRAADATRQPELVPLRYGRMLQSPFTFYRGSAGVMAADLAPTPATGIHVQACGDAHLLNFGGFATPERRLVVSCAQSAREISRLNGTRGGHAAPLTAETTRASNGIGDRRDGYGNSPASASIIRSRNRPSCVSHQRCCLR
jgi:Uncharacterized protein conserved in bacteria (DUF2252)